MFCHVFILVLLNQSHFLVKSLKNGPPRPKIRCQNGDEKVFLVDDFLRPDEVEIFSNFMQQHRPWVLNYEDEYERDSPNMHSEATWVSPIPLELVQRTRLWRVLSGVVRELSTQEYFLCRAMFTMTYRMEFNPPSKDLEDGGIMVAVFLNGDMKKNHYGEQVFFNNNSDVLCGVHPVQGRMMIWNSSITYVSKPPSMLYVQSQNTIVMKLTESHSRHQQCFDHQKVSESSKSSEFPFIIEKSDRLQSIEYGNVNIGDHLTNKYADSRGYNIAVFDEILTKSDLDLLRSHLVKDYHSYGFHRYDSAKIEDNDNVAWISLQKVEILVKSGLWHIVKNTVQYLSGFADWFPYDVSMNVIHSFHHTRIHEDCENDEHEYTFLLYLNPDWIENDYGETVFFDLVNSTKEIDPGDEEFEIVSVVRPHYGRIVVFRGNIPHSARPPSPGFKGARYTFACKVSKTHRTAQAKQIQEILEALRDHKSEASWDELSLIRDSEHEVTFEGRTDNFMKIELAKQKQRLEDWRKDNQELLLKELSQ